MQVCRRRISQTSRLIFALHPQARNRINTVYMVTYFIGGAFGSALASIAWEYYKWAGFAWLGIGLVDRWLWLSTCLNQKTIQKIRQGV